MRKKSFLVSCFIVAFALILGSCSFINDKKEIVYTKPSSVIKTQTDLIDTITPTDIVNSNIDSVVTIFVETNGSNEQVSFGSGVAVHAGGYILTNYHVVSTAVDSEFYSLKVYHNNSKEPHNAEILWYNVNFDLAIIKCECGDMPFVEMVDRFIKPTETSKLQPLEQVVAIGTPIDFSLQNTATTGYVSSALGRISYSDTKVVYENLIQHTAPINHGNSGGPLFDMKGKLIGLNTLGNEEANSIYFAVPVYPAIMVIEKVVSAYEQNRFYNLPVLGVSGVDRYMAEKLSENNFDNGGLLVTGITDGCGAIGKLKVNDIIVGITINEEKFNIDLRNDLLFALLKASSGDSVTVHFIRNSIEKTDSIVLS